MKGMNTIPMSKKVTFSSCDKPKCKYYMDMEFTLGSTTRGLMCWQHCVLCVHLIKHDLYTRLEVGE